MSESILYTASKDLKVGLVKEYKNSYILATKVLEELWKDTYKTLDFNMFELEMNFKEFRNRLEDEKETNKSKNTNNRFILLEFFTAQAFYVKDKSKVLSALEYIKTKLEGNSLEYLNKLIEDIKTISEDELLFMYTPTTVSDVWETRLYLDTDEYLENKEDYPNVKEECHDFTEDLLECSLDEGIGQQAGGIIIFDKEGIAQTKGYHKYDFNSY